MNIALAIIVDPSRRMTLIAQRSAESDHLPGKWEFPGGKMEGEETAAECAVREAAEETAVRPTIMEAWPPVTFVYPDRTVTLHPFLCEAERLISFDATWTWVPIAELGDYDFPDANAPLIEKLRHIESV